MNVGWDALTFIAMTCRIGRTPPPITSVFHPPQRLGSGCRVVIDSAAAKTPGPKRRFCPNCEAPMHRVLLERHQPECADQLEQEVCRCEGCLSTIRFVFRIGAQSAVET
jgi:hypothetical protein